MLYPIENRVREVKDLNGIWKFKIDKDNKGLEEKWYESPLKDTIPMAVPASYNDLLTDMEEKEHVGYVWYETTFAVPAGWDEKRIMLRFGSAAHHAICWINGREMIRHKGGFLPFEADITKIVKEEAAAEEYRLTVALSNILDWSCLPSGEVVAKEGAGYPKGYHYQDTFFDFYNYAGIHRPVRLYATPRHYIEDIVIKTSLNEAMTEAAISCRITGTDVIRSVKVLDEEGNVAAEAEEISRDTKLTVKAPILWQPGKAYLYRLRVEGQEDIYTESFGIRSIQVTDRAFLINGKEFYFRGFGKHEDSDIHGRGMDQALNVKDFALLKWMGANSFRTSHYPYSEELMMLADREGIVIIDEAPAVGMCFWQEKKVFDGSRVNEETLKHHLDVLKDMYERDKNHPCVVMWSVANEADTSEEGAAVYFKKVIDTMRSLDDTRPVTMVHTMWPGADLVSQWLDVICLNRYFGWYSDHGHLEVIGLQLKKELNEWYEKYQKPMIMTEYGADTIAGLHKLPPVTFSEEFQCAFLEQYHRIFDELDFVVGEHVWAFADFQTKQGLTRVDGNKKGVFTRNRQPKMAAYILKERWTGKRHAAGRRGMSW